MTHLYRSAYYEMTEETGLGLVTLRRSGIAYPHHAVVRAEVERIVECFEPMHRTLGIVVDMRHAPSSNDPAFEAAMRHLRFAVGRAFARVVVLVATATGEMQASRLHREGRFVYFVSRDPTEARELAGGLRKVLESGKHPVVKSSRLSAKSG